MMTMIKFKDDSLFGTPAWKLHRNNSPDTSVDAAQHVDTTVMERLVFDEIARFGRHGCIQQNLLDRLVPHAFSYSSITARFKALADKGMISRGPDQRKGSTKRYQNVMRAVLDASKWHQPVKPPRPNWKAFAQALFVEARGSIDPADLEALMAEHNIPRKGNQP